MLFSISNCFQQVGDPSALAEAAKLPSLHFMDFQEHFYADNNKTEWSFTCHGTVSEIFLFPSLTY